MTIFAWSDLRTVFITLLSVILFSNPTSAKAYTHQSKKVWKEQLKDSKGWSQVTFTLLKV